MSENVNIFLITIDCLRADYVGVLGNKENLTPYIDNLANNGVVFSQAIVNGPSTPFSFPSIFASSYPLIDPNFPKLSKYRTTISKVLKENGIITAGFNSNPYLSKYYNYNIGFSFFDDIFSEEKKPQTKGFKSKIKKYKKLYNILKFLKNKLKYSINPPYQRAEIINDKVLKWLREKKSKNFVWIHYMDTHHPFLAPKKYRNTSSRKMYKAEKILKKNPSKVSEKQLNNIKRQYKATIKYVDNEIGILLEELQKLKLASNSLFIITADHGEEFKEHGGFSHNSKLYEELVHIPLILKGPKVPKNKKINNLVSLIDIAPTIIDYLGLETIEDFMGESLLPLFSKNDKGYIHDGVFTESLIKKGTVSLSYKEGYTLISYRTKDWKLIINDENNTRELYNLLEDPHEKANVYSQHLDIAEKFEEKILQHKKMEQKLQLLLKEREKIRIITDKIILDDF